MRIMQLYGDNINCPYKDTRIIDLPSILVIRATRELSY